MAGQGDVRFPWGAAEPNDAGITHLQYLAGLVSRGEHLC
ncbi:MAG TPA: hypothetical protein DEA75_19435 [Rhodobacteraceae bacterium]|nr:hypothetical protein [Paracoccaceae bacterium]